MGDSVGGVLGDSVGDGIGSVLGGLGSDASSTVVRKAHRDLSREWHPDKWHGDADKLAEAESMQVKLNLAKDVLLARAKPSTRVGASEWDADEL